VKFLDLSGSTEVAEALGAERPRDLLSAMQTLPSRQIRRNILDNAWTDKRKFGLRPTHRLPSRATPPPGTTQWTWGVMGERLAPAVQPGDQADPGGQAPGRERQSA
jgi:hypothetical protein